MDTANQLQITGLSCVRQQKPLFANISFELHPGHGLLIEGPNGSGKSSLLRLLSGLATPTTGDIFWNGLPIQDERAEFSNAIHYIGHSNGIKLGLTILENLCLANSLSHASQANDYLAIEQVLSLLQLSDHKNSETKLLSAGQKRRVALAKLFLFPKTIWLLDEPFTALDTNIQTLFLDKLTQHLQNNGIAIISSHHPIRLANMTTLRLPTC